MDFTNFSILGFEFVDSAINKETPKFANKIAALVENPTPDFQSKIKRVTESVCQEISKSCVPSVEKMNKFVKKKFSIPSDVLLLDTEKQLTQVTRHEMKDLEAKCKELKNTVKENFYFLQALETELKGYEELDLAFDNGNMSAAKAEEMLHSNLNLSILEIAAKNIKNVQ